MASWGRVFWITIQLPCTRRSRRSRWNRTASLAARLHDFCPSSAKEEWDGHYLMILQQNTKCRQHIWEHRGLTIGCCSRTVLSRSPCSQNSAATIRATWKHGNQLMLANGRGLTMRRQARGLARTLLWTSHGFVMADRSQAVIIIALRHQEWTFLNDKRCTSKDVAASYGNYTLTWWFPFWLGC